MGIAGGTLASSGLYEEVMVHIDIGGGRTVLIDFPEFKVNEKWELNFREKCELSR